jgi:queuine tRNA-ribosyltransferase
MSFEILKKCSFSKGRRGVLKTAHGEIQTPIFMPVGTRGAVKALTNAQVEEVKAQIILGNTYHLMLRPGEEIIKKAGGLHRFMNWNGPILTDSGGYQVFSLSALNKITDEGVWFQSHIDGKRLFLGPKESMGIQKCLGSDIVMSFDECCPYPSSYETVKKSLIKTDAWAKICREYPLHPHQLLFGIVQGGVFKDLRIESAKSLTALDFPGYAIGGLSVGEPDDLMYEMVDVVEPYLPQNKPRYLMGVGTPRNLIEAVIRGVDMFDCVMPTRNGRNGCAFTWSGKISIKAGCYREDFSPLDEQLDSYASKFSKAYIRHLFNVDEMTGMTLVSMQNLAFYLDFCEKMRQAIEKGTLESFYEFVCRIYPK